MQAACPRCHRSIELDDAAVGRPCKCPACLQVFVVPATGATGGQPPAGTAQNGGGLGFVRFIAFLLFVAAAAFGYAMFRFHETPAQTWARLTGYFEAFRHPPAASPPEPTTEPLPAPPSAVLAPANTGSHENNHAPTADPALDMSPAQTNAAGTEESLPALGAIYTPQATTFRLFAPGAKAVGVVLYDAATGTRGRVEHPLKGQDDFWAGSVAGDLRGKFYVYRLDGPGLDPTREVLDPYAVNAVASSTRGRITELPPPTRPGPRVTSATDIVVYEMHVRDFTFAPSSNVQHRGLYLGFTEPDTHLADAPQIRTALDHLTELGVTHVELLPVQDFDNDEAKPRFNWGYITTAFFSPEGMYATNPNDDSRVREFKALIDALHARGIGVIMDVVYNHTAGNAPFQSVAPGYYYRHRPDGELANGSGCGNEWSSETPMGRRLILDSLKFWTREYGIDGYRFDLMALLDQDTMRQAERELRAINPNVVLFGEPWTGGDSPLQDKTDKGAFHQVPVGAFNDDFRNALKGSPDGRDPGFIQNGSNRDALENAMRVSDWLATPAQSINYMTCHDNLVLWDKLKASMPNADEHELIETMKLGYLALLTSQGVPYMQGGEEFGRTKGGNNNSYDAPDSVNAVDWSLKRRHLDLFTYVRDAIALRKAHPVFRLRSRQQIEPRLRFVDTPDKVLMYTLDGSGVPGEGWRRVCVVLNADGKAADLTLPEGGWSVALDAAGAARGESMSGKISVRQKSGLVLYQR